MDGQYVLATEDGIVLAERNGSGWETVGQSLESEDGLTVIAREGVVLAGTRCGVFRSEDGGRSWDPASEGLSLRHVRWLAYDPDVSDHEFAGTEPAGIFVSCDGAGTWQGRPEVERLRDKHHWFLPYSPEAGCVRGFAFHGERMYAAVEVGGVLRSDDAGETWRLAGGSTGEPAFEIPPSPLIHADVHSIGVHPSSPDLVYAATAEGLYLSADGGESWTVTHAGSYCRAFWVDPADPNHIVLGPADSVAHKNGRIEETRDRGRTWQPATDGLDLAWPDRMAERFLDTGDALLMVTSDGRLYEGTLPDLWWRQVLPTVPGIHAVAQSS